MQYVSAYRLKDRWLLHPLRRTTAGLLVASEPFVSFPLTAEPEVLGVALVSALEHSEGVVPHPTDWKSHAQPRLAEAGVKSERSFQVGSLLVSIERSPQSYRLEPTRNGGAKGSEKGFLPLAERGVNLPLTASYELLGSALKKAVLQCSQET